MRFPARQQRSPVPASADLERVLRLPRRPPLDLGSARAEALAQLVTERLRRPGVAPDGSECACRGMGRRCFRSLTPAQAWALWEAPLAGGLFGAVRVGAGKTLLDLLAPVVMCSRHAVLLVPPGLVDQLVSEYLWAREHLRVPTLVADSRHWFAGDGAPVVRVVPYSRLSRPEATALLDELRPDLVVADELHRLKSPESARTARFLRLFLARPGTRFCGWSGTPTSRSLRDFYHLLALALGDGSPLPVDPREADRWADAVDPSGDPAPEGALARLRDATGAADVREAVRVRLSETLGVVTAAGEASCAAAVVLRERRPPRTPAVVVSAMDCVKRTRMRPDGELLVGPAELARCLRELSCGFYYRWVFPDDLDPALVDEWFAARKAWRGELVWKLEAREAYLDSPYLCELAAARAASGEPPAPARPAWHSRTWARWAAVKDRVSHDQEAVWLSPWLAEDAAAWARSPDRVEAPGGVWCLHEAFAGRVADFADLPLHRGGPGDRAALLASAARGPAVVSVEAHGTGTDGLQRVWRAALVANSISSGDAYEQLVGRYHRVGQEADEVLFEVYRHTPEAARAVDRAAAQARYVRDVTGAEQALLSADVEWRLDPAAAAGGDEEG